MPLFIIAIYKKMEIKKSKNRYPLILYEYEQPISATTSVSAAAALGRESVC